MKPLPFRLLSRLLLSLAALFFGVQAWALQAGLRQITIEGEAPDQPATVVALYYPTEGTARRVPMGPLAPLVAIQAPPVDSVKGLILLSHGTGGSELGHSSLAEALARSGYLVAALRHPRDNWQDASLLEKTPERYFTERPRQASRVIDALLKDPLWKDRIARDAQGLRIGAVGHSAGGYTVLALAGGEPDYARIGRHCADERANDPIFCSTGGRTPGAASAPPAPVTGLADRRVRAVVALAPVGVVFNPDSLARIAIPVTLYAAEGDRWLVPRFHAEWLAARIPKVEFHRVPNAWHLSFLDKPSMPIPTADGDLGADSPAFDRAEFLQRLAVELPAYFDRTLR
jgi:predicted dienelactone hydrolase